MAVKPVSNGDCARASAGKRTSRVKRLRVGRIRRRLPLRTAGNRRRDMSVAIIGTSSGPCRTAICRESKPSLPRASNNFLEVGYNFLDLGFLKRTVLWYCGEGLAGRESSELNCWRGSSGAEVSLLLLVPTSKDRTRIKCAKNRLRYQDYLPNALGTRRKTNSTQQPSNQLRKAKVRRALHTTGGHYVSCDAEVSGILCRSILSSQKRYILPAALISGVSRESGVQPAPNPEQAVTQQRPTNIST